MRNVRLIALLQALPTAILAEDMTTTNETSFSPPPYHEILRFDEDYSYLSDPALRQDWFDPIKYIPLRAKEPDWYLTLGGGLRERFQGTYNPNFGIGGTAPDSVWLQRITFLGDLHLGERVRVFAEGISGLAGGGSEPAPPVDDDPIDLQFAFADVVPYLTEDARLTLRGGRFGMYLGSGRLVATRAAPNIPLRFDGFETLYSQPSWNAVGFLARPVEDTGAFAGGNPNTIFWGLYLTHWFDAPRKVGVDAYYLGISNEQATYASGTASEHRQTFGVRLFGERSQWDWNEENVLQVGSFGDQSILAWTVSFDGGYTFDQTWQPRVGLKADIASGDRNPSAGPQGTFDPLYFKSAYFNDASLIRPANIIDVHPNLAVNLSPKISLNGGVDVFWRYSTSDAVYAPPGYIEIPALTSAPAYIATAVDVNMQWQIQRHVTFSASYVHFFTGSYVHAAGGSDVNYFSTTLSFLF
jgi:Alginate export